jgi:hypothetical protein
MNRNVIIVDNFYTNVMGTRDFILTQDFPVKGNYPGGRTKSYATDQIKDTFEKIIGKKITYFSTEPTSYNGAFQYTTKDMVSWIHRDATDYAALIYLTPNAPVDSGTGFFRHIETGLEEVEYNTPKDIQKQLDTDSNKMDKWEMVDYVGNKFNRLVLFRGTRSHRSMKYFGDTKHDGRLFQVFFFNVENGTTYQTQQKLIKAGTPNEIIPKYVASIQETLTLPALLWERPKKIKIAVLFFTTSRYEYLIPMFQNFYEKVNFDDIEIYTILTDDYPLRRQDEVLTILKNKYKIDKLITNKENLGYGLSWKNAWKEIPADVDYIWHQEEDFIFDDQINIMKLIETFETCPIKFTQICLKRQVWFSGNDFITKIEDGSVGRQINYGDKKIVIHQRYFNANPCLYPRWVIEEEYVNDPQEHTLVKELATKYPNKYSAIYGGRNDKPATRHIGDYTQGKKVIPGQPGYDMVKHYDPEKKYYSKHFLREYKGPK